MPIEDNKKKSYDTNDFDISFARGLNLEDGPATLTDFTASIISEELISSLNNSNKNIQNIRLCGGGRKNKILLQKISRKFTIEYFFKIN